MGRDDKEKISFEVMCNHSELGSIPKATAWEWCKEEGAALGIPQHRWTAEHFSNHWRWTTVKETY